MVGGKHLYNFRSQNFKPNICDKGKKSKGILGGKYMWGLQYLDVLNEVGGAIGNLLGGLHKVSLGNGVAGLGRRHLAGIA